MGEVSVCPAVLVAPAACPTLAESLLTVARGGRALARRRLLGLAGVRLVRRAAPREGQCWTELDSRGSSGVRGGPEERHAD